MSDNKIIEITGKDAEKVLADKPQKARPQPGLTIEDVLPLRKAVIRLRQLKDQSIATPTSDAEINGLQNFLAGALMANADEFIGTWLVCTTEYMALVKAWTAFNSRCAGLMQQAADKVAQPKGESK